MEIFIALVTITRAMLFILVMVNVIECVLHAGVYFFARVKEALRIEYVFSLFKQRTNIFAIHQLKERTADEAVVVFGGDGSFVLHNKFVYFL